MLSAVHCQGLRCSFAAFVDRACLHTALNFGCSTTASMCQCTARCDRLHPAGSRLQHELPADSCCGLEACPAGLRLGALLSAFSSCWPAVALHCTCSRATELQHRPLPGRHRQQAPAGAACWGLLLCSSWLRHVLQLCGYVAVRLLEQAARGAGPWTHLNMANSQAAVQGCAWRLQPQSAFRLACTLPAQSEWLSLACTLAGLRLGQGCVPTVFCSQSPCLRAAGLLS